MPKKKNFDAKLKKSNNLNTESESLSRNMQKICDYLISLKNEHSAINSKYLKSIREFEDVIIPALLTNKYSNNLGSVSAYDRFFVNISEDDYYTIRDYCRKNGLDIDDFIDVKVSYKATPRFRKIILKADDFDMPFVDRIQKKKFSYLKVRLAV